LTPEEAKGRAEHAKQLLEDPILKESFDLAQTALIQAIRVAKTDTEAFKATIAFQVFEVIRDSIKTHIETAKVIEYNFKDRTFLDRISGK
jgi:hypothetical protein